MKLANIRLDNPFVQSPMSGITDKAFRTSQALPSRPDLHRMISAEALCGMTARRSGWRKSTRATGPAHQTIRRSRPSGRGTRIVEGWERRLSTSTRPVRAKVVKVGAGERSERSGKLESRSHSGGRDIPVSSKLRLGYDKDVSRRLWHGHSRRLRHVPREAFRRVSREGGLEHPEKARR